jgi:hypothetical protein
MPPVALAVGKVVEEVDRARQPAEDAERGCTWGVPVKSPLWLVARAALALPV